MLAKHSKAFSLIDCISVGVDRMQRNFEPMRKQVEAWQRSELTDVTAKVVIYEAFIEADWKLQNTWPAAYMTSTSSQSTRNSGREPSGAFRMRSLRHSRNWIPSRSSRPQPSWASFWRPGSHNRSSPQGGINQPPFPKKQPHFALGDRCGLSNWSGRRTDDSCCSSQLVGRISW